MKIDLHVHMKKISSCAKETGEQMAQAALERGIKGIVLLDHNYQTTKEECVQIEASVPGIKVFRGLELNVAAEHVVIVSSHVVDFPLPEYTKRMLDFKTLSEWINKTNSLAILAHPFRYHDDITIDFEQFRPQAIELVGRHVKREHRERIAGVAKQYGMAVVSVSDSHKGKQLGGYCIETDNDVASEEDLIDSVCYGKYTLMENQLVPVATYGRNEKDFWMIRKPI